jgi:hypothetical protein
MEVSIEDVQHVIDRHAPIVFPFLVCWFVDEDLSGSKNIECFILNKSMAKCLVYHKTNKQVNINYVVLHNSDEIVETIRKLSMKYTYRHVRNFAMLPETSGMAAKYKIYAEKYKIYNNIFMLCIQISTRNAENAYISILDIQDAKQLVYYNKNKQTHFVINGIDIATAEERILHEIQNRSVPPDG